MLSAVRFAYYISYALILLTGVSAAHAVWRHRRFHRLDPLWLALLLALSRFRQPLGAVGMGVVLAVPYVLLRLVGHFRNISRALQWAALLAVAVGIVAFAQLGARHLPTLAFLTPAYTLLVKLYVVAAFGAEARHTSGVTARRLEYALAGTMALALEDVFAALAPWYRPHSGGDMVLTLHIVALACYYLAFSTPRRFRSAWQRVEWATYVSATADLAPEERGRRTATDLCRAVRSIGNAAVLVALRPSVSDDAMSVSAATDDALVGMAVVPGRGVVGDVYRSGQAAIAPTSALEPALAAQLSGVGRRALVAPVVSSARTWGVVIAVQRFGSLFPEDDLNLLLTLGRYAGTGLDYAQLVLDARERERKAADRRLREVESRMSLLLDNVRDYAMIVLDARGRVVTWHVGAEHIFGYRAAEMADEPAWPLYELSEEDFLRLLEEARGLGRAEREARCRRRGDEVFLGATIIRPLTQSDDELEGFVAVTRDVTEQRDLEQRFRQSQKMDAIGRLAGGIAHDFNNLLTAILGYADLLGQQLPENSEHLASVGEIQKAAQRAAGLTRQLLAFSRQQMLQPMPISVSRIAADLLPMLHRLIGEHIRVVDDIAADVGPVLGDRGQLEQVLLNLAVNARDAMPAGGELTIRTARVWLDPSTAGDLMPGPHVLLEVADTGVGMDAPTQARIFEPFFTTKEFGRGTGLGLATVYGIVKQMNGSVRLSSAPGRGTTFRLYFPETRGWDLRPLPSAAVEPPRGVETLLLVEDDPGVRAFLTQVLTCQGYRVLAAEHQTAALNAAAAFADPIHLVITDVVMPGGAGPELMAALDAVRPGMPALYISGYADLMLFQQGAFPQASHFLQKPFSAADLLTRIRQILSNA
jgi:PAS domain S-box-containing protein